MATTGATLTSKAQGTLHALDQNGGKTIIGWIWQKGREFRAWRRAARQRAQIAAYKRNGCRPWSEGYQLFRQQFIQEVSNDQTLLKTFKEGGALPPKYGEFLDERVVEYPWLLSRLAGCRGRLLDAGSTLNYDFILQHKTISALQKTIITLAPEGNCYWQKGISYCYDDLREMPFRDGYFTVAACISTLEHIGMDNQMYTGSERNNEEQPEAYLTVIKELRRITRSSGTVYLTMPYGCKRNYGYFQQFTRTMVQRVIETFSPRSLSETYFAYRDGGWTFAEATECDTAECFDFRATRYYDSQNHQGYDEDYAACSRAIVALALVR